MRLWYLSYRWPAKHLRSPARAFAVRTYEVWKYMQSPTNQRTSGPLNAHLTPGPGIYFNAFIHVYSPRPVADNPLRTNVDVNRKPLSLCPFVLSFKTISLKYDFKHILNDFIHVYSPRARAENPWEQTFDVNRKPLSLRPFVTSFKQMSLNSDFIHIF